MVQKQGILTLSRFFIVQQPIDKNSNVRVSFQLPVIAQYRISIDIRIIFVPICSLVHKFCFFHFDCRITSRRAGNPYHRNTHTELSHQPLHLISQHGFIQRSCPGNVMYRQSKRTIYPKSGARFPKTLQNAPDLTNELLGKSLSTHYLMFPHHNGVNVNRSTCL